MMHPSQSLRGWHIPDKRLLYAAGIILAFVLGCGAANGWATHNALQGQAQYFHQDCRVKVQRAVGATKAADRKTAYWYGIPLN